MKGSSPVVELTLPVLPDMELAATKTAEVVAKHMDLSDEKSAEISMALIEACINAFEHSGTNKQIEIHFRIKEDVLEIQVTDRGKGFDESKVNIPKIEEKIVSDRKRGWGLQLIKELMDSVACYEKIETGKKHFLLNLEKSTVVNSIGVSILIEIIEKLQDHDGKLGYFNLAPIVEKTFSIMGLTKYSTIFTSEGEAIAEMS